jgi:hypothetical protein
VAVRKAESRRPRSMWSSASSSRCTAPDSVTRSPPVGAANDVGRPAQLEVGECCGSEDGSVALGADDDDLHLADGRRGDSVVARWVQRPPGRFARSRARWARRARLPADSSSRCWTPPYGPSMWTQPPQRRYSTSTDRTPRYHHDRSGTHIVRADEPASRGGRNRAPDTSACRPSSTGSSRRWVSGWAPWRASRHPRTRHPRATWRRTTDDRG